MYCGRDADDPMWKEKLENLVNEVKEAAFARPQTLKTYHIITAKVRELAYTSPRSREDIALLHMLANYQVIEKGCAEWL